MADEVCFLVFDVVVVQSWQVGLGSAQELEIRLTESLDDLGIPERDVCAGSLSGPA